MVDLSGVKVDISGAVVVKDLSGAVVVKDLSGAVVVKDLSGAVVVKDLSGAVVVKDLSGAVVVKDLSGAVVAVDTGKSCCSCCCAKAKPAVKEWIPEKTKTTDLSGVVSDLAKELLTSSVDVNDVILALPRLLAAAREAGAADNSELVKLKHSARALLSQCVKDDRAATAFADTYLHAVCAALLCLAPAAAKAEPVVSVVEKKVTSGGRSWFVCWKR